MNYPLNNGDMTQHKQGDNNRKKPSRHARFRQKHDALGPLNQPNIATYAKAFGTRSDITDKKRTDEAPNREKNSGQIILFQKKPCYRKEKSGISVPVECRIQERPELGIFSIGACDNSVKQVEHTTCQDHETAGPGAERDNHGRCNSKSKTCDAQGIRTNGY
jgi:hypothetical protein